MANPVLAASGTFGYGLEFADLLDDSFRHPIINSYVAKLRWRFSN